MLEVAIEVFTFSGEEGQCNTSSGKLQGKSAETQPKSTKHLF
jgi:hypothetical protein